jgi:antitoxin VapB
MPHFFALKTSSIFPVCVKGQDMGMAATMDLQRDYFSDRMYTYIQMNDWRHSMINTRLFKNGHSQAVRIPAELAYKDWQQELVIERHGDELRIRPAQKRMGDVLAALAQFSPDFMQAGRQQEDEEIRAAL